MKLILLLLLSTQFFSHSFSVRKEPKVNKDEPTVEEVMKTSKPQASSKELTDINSPIFKESFKKVSLKRPDFNKKALKKAFTFLDENHLKIKTENTCFEKNNIRNKEKIRNLSCMVIADYSKEKTKKRLLVINPTTGDSEYFYTAHGKGSNPPDKKETALKAVRFSNTSGSLMTSLGFYLTDKLYNSQKSTFGPGPGNGLRLDGLNCSNNKAKSRYIVMHTADYVPPKTTVNASPGNSEGCVTVPENRKDILKKCENGALVFAFSE